MDSKVSTVSQDLIITPNFPALERGGVLEAGQNLARGSALGQITANSKLKLMDTANADGSENFFCVLADSIDATAADTQVPYWRTGEFIEDKLIFGGATVINDAIRAQMEARSCFPKAAAELNP